MVKCESRLNVLIMTSFFVLCAIMLFGGTTAEARVDASHQSHTSQGAKGSMLSTEYTVANKSYNDVPKSVADAWQSNQIAKGDKNQSESSGKLLLYDVYAGVTSNENKRGYVKEDVNHISFDGWAVNFGYHHHTKDNQATYIGLVNKDTGERKIYKAAMRDIKGDLNSETNHLPSVGPPSSPYCASNVFQIDPTGTSYNPQTSCNMEYGYVYFRALLPLDDLFSNGATQSAWGLYIIKEVENHLVYDTLAVPFDAKSVDYKSGVVDLQSGVNNDKLKVIASQVIKRVGPSTSSQALAPVGQAERYFIRGNTYPLVKSSTLSDYVNEAQGINVRYRVKDVTAKYGSRDVWISSAFAMNTGTQTMLKYTRDVDAPKKEIQTGSSVETSNTVTLGDSFTYNIDHTIPKETASFYYTSYGFEDSIHEALNIGTVKVMDGNKDVTSLFTVSKTNNVVKATATAASLNTASFYGKTYRLVIPVTVENSAKILYFSGNNAKFTVDNTAKITVGNKSKSSNTVTTTINVPQKSEFRNPVKTVTDKNGTEGTTNVVGPGDSFKYTIEHAVLSEHPIYYYSNYSIIDTIHGALKINSVKIFDKNNGQPDLTNRFTISIDSKTNQIVATAKPTSLKNSSFYDITYRMVVDVEVIGTDKILDYAKDTNSFSFNNIATITRDESFKNTGSVTSEVVIPKVKLGLKKIEIPTNNANKGLKVALSTTSEVPHAVFDKNNVSMKLYQVSSNGARVLIATNKFTVADFPATHVFTVPNDKLQVNTKCNYVVELTEFNANQLDIPANVARIDTDGHTSSEKVINLADNGSSYKERGIIKTEREIGKDMVLYYEELTIPAIQHDRIKTGYGLPFKRELIYVNDLGDNAEISTHLLIDKKIGAGVYENEDRKSRINMVRAVNDARSGGKITQTYTMDVPAVFIDKKYDKEYAENGNGRIAAGHKIYIPVWLDDLGTYDLIFKSNEPIGVHGVQFVAHNDVDVYAYMFSHIDSGSDDASEDELLIGPMDQQDANNIWEN
jgi:hypothetical protein